MERMKWKESRERSEEVRREGKQTTMTSTYPDHQRIQYNIPLPTLHVFIIIWEEKEMKVGSHDKRGQQKRGNHVKVVKYIEKKKRWERKRELSERKKDEKEQSERRREKKEDYSQSTPRVIFPLTFSWLLFFFDGLPLSTFYVLSCSSYQDLARRTFVSGYFKLLRCFKAVVPTSNFIILHDPRLSCHVRKEEGQSF